MHVIISDLPRTKALSWIPYRRWYASLKVPPLARLVLAVLWDAALERPSDFDGVDTTKPPIVRVSQRTLAGWIGSDARSVRRSVRELEKAELVSVMRKSGSLGYALAVPVIRLATSWTPPSEDELTAVSADRTAAPREVILPADTEVMTESIDRYSLAPKEREVSPSATDGRKDSVQVSPKQQRFAFGLARSFCSSFEAERLGLEIRFVGRVLGRLLAEGHQADCISSRALSAAETTYAARVDGLVEEVQRYWAGVLDEKIQDGLSVEARVKRSLEASRNVRSRIAASIRSGGFRQ